jgi:photosystem II stability/assembly factor-like uncharacterized protein
MKLKIAFILPVILLAFASNAFSQWVETNSPFGTVVSFAENGGNIFAGGGGVSLSTDNGTDWSNPQQNLGYVSNMVVYGDYLIAAAANNGVCRSRDSGRTWLQANNGLTDKLVFAIAIIGNELVAGTSYGGIYSSVDSGMNWTEIHRLQSEINELLVVGSDLYTGTTSLGILLSTDYGINWKEVNTGITTLDVHLLRAQNSSIYAGTDSGVFISSDKGLTWIPANKGLLDTDVHALAVSGNNLFAGTFNKGVFLSTDNGAMWKQVNTGLTNTNIHSLAIIGSSIFAGTFYGSIWRRSLSDFGISAVRPANISNDNVSSFPNPFSSKTTVSFSNEQREFVSVNIVDVLGKQCAQIFNGELDGGTHSYEWDASRIAPGMYLCIIRANGVAKEIPMMVVR